MTRISKRAFNPDISGYEHLEIWQPVISIEQAVEVSSLGRVRKHGKVVIQRLHATRGYPVVDVALRETLVHRLVLLAFVGPAPKGHEACHGNGIKTDNRLENLRWGTHSENSRDQVEHGTHRNIRKTHCMRGHLFDEANTYIRPAGQRLCRTCRRLKDEAKKGSRM